MKKVIVLNFQIWKCKQFEIRVNNINQPSNFQLIKVQINTTVQDLYRWDWQTWESDISHLLTLHIKWGQATSRVSFQYMESFPSIFINISYLALVSLLRELKSDWRIDWFDPALANKKQIGLRVILHTSGLTNISKEKFRNFPAEKKCWKLIGLYSVLCPLSLY